MQRCREGWHLDTEPEHQVPEPDEETEDDAAGDDEPDRRERSTRRRQDAPDLPRLPIEDRTIGRVFTAPGGKAYRPSMFRRGRRRRRRPQAGLVTSSTSSTS